MDGDSRNRKFVGSMIPKITKNTNTKKFEIDFSLLREDPLFGDYRKNNIPKRLVPIKGKPKSFLLLKTLQLRNEKEYFNALNCRLDDKDRESADAFRSTR